MPPATLAAGSYSAQFVTLYVLLLLDVCVNATADTSSDVNSRMPAIWVLVAQTVVRIACAATSVAMLASSRSWHDEFLLQYCGVFAISLFSLILCLFARVYRVTLASFPERYPSILDFWASEAYCLLLLGHTLLSLLFYYYSLTSAHRMGARSPLSAITQHEGGAGGRPSTYAALALSSRRRSAAAS